MSHYQNRFDVRVLKAFMKNSFSQHPGGSKNYGSDFHIETVPSLNMNKLILSTK